MLRSKIALAAAAALVAILNTTVRADDAGVSAAPPGAPIVNAAPDAAPPVTTHETTFGTEFRQPIGQNADDQAAGAPKPPRPAAAARHDDDDPGPAIANAAQKTGRAIDNGTKDFRNGAEKFFKDVGHFFSGDK